MTNNLTRIFIQNDGKVGIGTGTPDELLHVNGNIKLNGRFLGAKGADVASANDITLGTDGSSFDITGSTNVQTISATGWTEGSVIKLFIKGSITFENDVSGSGASILLTGGNFSGTNNDNLVLELNNSKWNQIGRNVI